jgi:glycyl-tRNA synthetase
MCAFFDSVDEDKKVVLPKEMSDKGSITINLNGTDFVLTNEFVKFESQEKKIVEEKYTPSVIEPSYGIGRIVYCVFEHCFKTREQDAQRTYFDFPPCIAPIKCTILPLMS